MICPSCGWMHNLNCIKFYIRYIEKEQKGLNTEDNNDLISDMNIRSECCRNHIMGASIPDDNLKSYLSDYYSDAKKKIFKT